jgi:hypothetical protein
LTALVSVNFLNNSTSSWEVMMEPWPVELLLSNPTNKIFKDARTTWVLAGSRDSGLHQANCNQLAFAGSLSTRL